MDPEAKDDRLWFHIARAFYVGLAGYFVLLLLAFLRDLWRKMKPFARLMRHRRSRFSITRIHHSFVARYRDTHVFYYVEFLRLAANTALCVIYVVQTYRRDASGALQVVQRVFFVLLVVDLLGRVWAAESAISSVFDWTAFFDAFSLPSLYLATSPESYLNFVFLRALPAYKAYSRLERRMFVKIFSSKRLIGKLAFQCIALFYTLACGIQLLEIPGDLLTPAFRDKWAAYGDWNFFNAVYFVIVTLSTVGYGDFSPITVQGRLYTILIIIVGIVIFTTAIGELVEQSQRGRGAGWFVKNMETRHVIVSGSPTLSDLVQFVSEFYSDSRDTNTNARVVILVENPPWTDVEWFQYIARNQFLQARIQFMVGSVRNVVDLQRVRLSSADAVFFLTSPSTGEDPSYQDARTVMNILAIRNVRTDVPIYAQTLLEGSSLQTNVALTTPTSYPKDTFLREENMRKNAAYGGLFHQVLKTECENLPWAHRYHGRRCFDEVQRHHRERQKELDAERPAGALLSDLERSRLVCLQATQASLLAANIKVNGVGTLLSNMYLDVQSSRVLPDDPGWLAEYHMGAACTMAYGIVPESLDGVAIREISDELYHVGLVIIATSDANEVQQHPILDTFSRLKRGDLAMFLTYLDHRFVGAALHLVAKRFENGELRHPFISTVSGSLESTFPVSPSSLAPSSPKGPQPSLAALKNGNKDSPRSALDRKLMIQEPDPPISLPSGRQVGDPKDILGSELLSSGHPRFVDNEQGCIPRNLEGHLIVAMDGEAPLENLPMFLRSLWRKDDRRAMRKARKTIVIVIAPTISDNFREKFRQHENKALFFLQGSPASSELWMEARLGKAKSVVTMADYTKTWHVSDARTIFTLLTLEVHTASDHDVYICSELVDEKSLEFLREPSHPRRVGAMFGEAVLPAHTPSVSRDFDSESRDSPGGDDGSSDPKNDLDETPEVHDAITHHDDIMGGKTAEEKAKEVLGTLSSTLNKEGRMAVGKASEKNLKSVKRALKVAALGDKQGGGGAVERRSLTKNPMMTESPGHAATGIDPSGKPGSTRMRRSSLFSRSRYASGELLIHSGTITILAREYVEPGFSNLFASLLGIETTSSPGLKIRLVRIPKAMFAGDRLVPSKDGINFVTYNSVFKALVRHGVTPLGIYRSGNAPTLIPRKSRRRRGRCVFDELEPYFHAEQESEQRKREKGKNDASTSGFIGSLIGSIAAVLPSQMRQARDRGEINGNASDSSSSSDEDSSDSDSRDNADGQQEFGEPDIERNASVNLRLGKSRSVRHKAVRKLRKVSSSPRGPDFLTKLVGKDFSLDVPGQCKYSERKAKNLLPYVYTLPDPNTLCSEADGIYILCHPTHELSSKWSETIIDNGDKSSSDKSGSTQL